MNFEALQIFCDVVRFQSFSRGAIANSVSQSAASQAVRQLEKRLQVQLIDRSKRPWQMTAEGKIFFQGCQEIVERYRELEESVQQHQEPSGYTIKLASIYSIRLPDLSRYVDEFQTTVPGATVQLEYMHPDEIYTRIHNDQSDLGLIAFATPGRDLTAIPWQQQTMVVTCLPSHKFSRRATAVGPWELSGESIVTFDRQLPVRRELDRYLRRHRAAVNIAAEFDNIENIKEAVEDGAGIAIVPEQTVWREVQRRTLVSVALDTIEGEAPFVRPLSIIHRRKRHLNPAVNALIKLLSRVDTEPATPAASRDASRNQGLTKRKPVQPQA